MAGLTLADLYDDPQSQSPVESDDSLPRKKLGLEDLYDLPEGETQRPPVVDDDEASSPTSSIVPPADPTGIRGLEFSQIPNVMSEAEARALQAQGFDPRRTPNLFSSQNLNQSTIQNQSLIPNQSFGGSRDQMIQNRIDAQTQRNLEKEAENQAALDARRQNAGDMDRLARQNYLRSVYSGESVGKYPPRDMLGNSFSSQIETRPFRTIYGDINLPVGLKGSESAASETMVSNRPDALDAQYVPPQITSSDATNVMAQFRAQQEAEKAQGQQVDEQQIELTSEQVRLKQFEEIFADPERIEEQEFYLRVVNPSVTPVRQGDDGQWYQVHSNVFTGGMPFFRAISKPEAALLIEQGRLYQRSNNPISLGASRIRDTVDTLAMQFKIMDVDDYVNRLTENARITPDAPEVVQEGLREITEAEGYWDATKAVITNPLAVLHVVGTSAMEFLPSIAALGVGAATGGPAGGVAAGATASFGQNFAKVIVDEITASGIDTENPQEVYELVSDPEFMARARVRGAAYAIPLTFFDAMSMGLAGKFLTPAIKAGASNSKIVGMSFAELGVQAGLGGAGEASAQTSEKLFGFRENLNPGEIVLEAIAELIPGFAEITIGTYGRIQLAESNREKNLLRTEYVEQTAANLAELDAKGREELKRNTGIDLDVTSIEDAAIQIQGHFEAVLEAAEAGTNDPDGGASRSLAAQGQAGIASPETDTLTNEPDGVSSKGVAAKGQAGIASPETDTLTNEPDGVSSKGVAAKGQAGIASPETDTLTNEPDGVSSRGVAAKGQAGIASPETDTLTNEPDGVSSKGVAAKGQAGIASPETDTLTNEPDGVSNIGVAAKGQAGIASPETDTLTNEPDGVSSRGVAAKGQALEPDPENDLTPAEKLDRAGKKIAEANILAQAVELAQNQDPKETEKMLSDLEVTYPGFTSRFNGIVRPDALDAPTKVAAPESVEAATETLSQPVVSDAAPSLSSLPTQEEAPNISQELANDSTTTTISTIFSELDELEPGIEDVFTGSTLPPQQIAEGIIQDLEQTNPEIRNKILEIANRQPEQGIVAELETEVPGIRNKILEVANRRRADELEQRQAEQQRTAVQTQDDTGSGVAESDEQTVETSQQTQEIITAETLPKTEYTSDPNAVETTSGSASAELRAGPEGTIIERENQTLRQSLFDDAFVSMGIDPSVGNTLPMAQKFLVLSKAMQRDFGFSEIRKSDGNQYDAANSLSDAYRNLRYMAAALQLPEFAMSLGGRMGLFLPSNVKGRKKFNAAFMPFGGETQTNVGSVKGPAIIMPKRSNSFAHEFAHAFDFDLFQRFGTGDNKFLITDRIRDNLKSGEKPWLENTPDNLQQAMGDLLNAMFFGNAEQAFKIMQLEQELAKVQARDAQTGKKSNKVADLQKRLQRERQGSSRSRLPKSNYRKGSERFAAEVGNVKYWTQPGEMLARAFEAYVAHMMAKLGASNEFVTKSDAAYQLTLDEVEGADMQLALAYPKRHERDTIFHAINKLMQAYKAEYYADMPAAKIPETTFTRDLRKDFDENVDIDAKRTFRSERQRDIKRITANKQKNLEQQEYVGKKYPLKTTTARALINAENYIGAHLFYGKKERLFSIANRYDDGTKLRYERQRLKKKNLSETRKKQIQENIKVYQNEVRIRRLIEGLISGLARQVGSGKRQTLEIGTYENGTNIYSRNFTNRLISIANNPKYDLFGLSTEDKKTLRLILTADPEVQGQAVEGADRYLLDAASEIRTKYLDPLYDYMRPHLEVTYLQDGNYMPRILNVTKVGAKEQQFLYGETGTRPQSGDPKQDFILRSAMTDGAYAMYHNVIYDKELGPFKAGDLDHVEKLLDLSKPELMLAANSTLPNERKALKKAFTSLKEKKNQIENAEQGVDTSQMKAEFDKGVEDIKQMHQQFYDNLRDPYANTAAVDWLRRVTGQVAVDPFAHAAQGRFMKQRKLPKEADSYMADFYKDPIDALLDYAPAVVRKVEYEKRFGAKLIPADENIASIDSAAENIDYFEHQLVKAQQLGFHPDDAEMFRLIKDEVIGRANPTRNRLEKAALDIWHALSTARMLARAVITSIPEAMISAMKTKSVIKGMDAFLGTFGDIMAPLRGKSAKEKKAFFKQLYNIMGTVEDPMMGNAISNRLDGNLGVSSNVAAWLTNYFNATALQGYTLASRRSAARMYLQYFQEISIEYQNPETSPDQKQSIVRVFNDVGIYNENVDILTKFMSESKQGQYRAPNPVDLQGANGELTKEGELLSLAMLNVVQGTVMHVDEVDRPLNAAHPLGRMVFALKGFQYKFSGEIISGTARKAKREAADRGNKFGGTALALAKFGPAIASYYALVFSISTLREYMFNQDVWEEKQENGTLRRHLLLLAFSRAGGFGRLDPFAQAVSGLRYSSDIDNVLVGPHTSSYSQDLANLIKLFTSFNNDETLSTERQFFRSFHNLGIESIGAMIAAQPRAFPLNFVAGGMQAFLTSPRAERLFADAMLELFYGESYNQGRRSSKTKSVTRQM